MIHCIFTSSSYSIKKQRIALDICGEDGIDVELTTKIIKKIFEQCGSDVKIAKQQLNIKGATWEDVVKYDSFFDNMYVAKDVDEFIDLINADRDLTAKDVARYILSKFKCTHLRLHKLLYLCYADYLCKTGEKLFEDKIISFKYGPIIRTVYDTYKGQYGNLSIDTINYKMPNDKSLMLPTKSKIYFVREGIDKAFSIDETLEYYKHCSAKSLVYITHRKDSPWSVTKQNDVIKDIDIKERHYIEKINKKNELKK